MTREIRLTRGYVTIVDDADYTRLRHYLWSVSGSPEKGLYAVSKIDGVTVRLHRFILGATGPNVVDHINGETLDNRRSNLRECTHRQNLLNQRRRKRPGYKGVSRRGGKWLARLNHDGTSTSTLHASELEAARAFDLMVLKHHGEFAAPNFPLDRDWLFPWDFSGEWPLTVPERARAKITELRGRA